MAAMVSAVGQTAKIASAPISWGIIELDDWGYQLPADRVFREMREVGFTATEIGPDGFLPTDPAAKVDYLAKAGLKGVGSFLPVILHRDDVDPLPRVARELDAFAAIDGEVLVLGAITGEASYDQTRAPLTDSQWSTLFANLERVTELAAQRGVRAALHPHVGTVVETLADVERVLTDSSMQFCFDTGHLLIGGTDPVWFATTHADRVAHVHLKDVSLEVLRRVKSGEISYHEGCVQGLYQPLGRGDIDIRTIVSALTGAGFDGWFALEQDQVLKSAPPEGTGPIEDAKASLTYLTNVLLSLA
jgi:inosose dehydratase